MTNPLLLMRNNLHGMTNDLHSRTASRQDRYSKQSFWCGSWKKISQYEVNEVGIVGATDGYYKVIQITFNANDARAQLCVPCVTLCVTNF